MAQPTRIQPEQIRPIADVVEYEETTAFALHLMDGAGLDALPVVSPGTGKLLGMVDRAELESACLGFHEPDRCVVRNHLRSHVPYCFETEPLDDDLLGRGADEPVVVVDVHLRPIGFLRGGGTARVVKTGVSHRPPRIPTDLRIDAGAAARSREVPAGVPVGDNTARHGGTRRGGGRPGSVGGGPDHLEPRPAPG